MTLRRPLAKVRSPLLHETALTRAVNIDVDAMNIDLMSISAHKIYGPKGIGACYIRRRPRVRIEPLFNGGGQERGLRSGTVPAPLVVGFGEACRIAKNEMAVSTLPQRARASYDENFPPRPRHARRSGVRLVRRRCALRDGGSFIRTDARGPRSLDDSRAGVLRSYASSEDCTDCRASSTRSTSPAYPSDSTTASRASAT